MSVLALQPYGIGRAAAADDPGLGDVLEHRLGGAFGVVRGDAFVDAAVAEVRRHAQGPLGPAQIAGGVDDQRCPRRVHTAHDAPHVEIETVFAAIEGEDPRGVTALYDRMLRRTFKAGHAGAVFGTIGALDTALWDIKAQAAGEPLWRLLGGRDRGVPAYASALDIGLTDDELVSVYQVYARHGLRAAKVKGGLDIERDRHRLTLVREVLAEAGRGARPGLMLDVNEAWTRKQAVRHVCELERTLDLTWIEEPVRRWDADGLAVVGRGIRASVATGENLTGLEQFRPLLAEIGRAHV